MRSLVFSVFALLIVGGMLAAIQHTNAQPPARDPERPSWLYKVMYVKDLVGDARTLDSMVPALEKSLNDAGGDGWELCQEIIRRLALQRLMLVNLAKSANRICREVLTFRFLVQRSGHYA